MATLPILPKRDFDSVRHDLENVVVLLKKTNSEHDMRLKLLRELRELLEEADRLIAIDDEYTSAAM